MKAYSALWSYLKHKHLGINNQLIYLIKGKVERPFDSDYDWDVTFRISRELAEKEVEALKEEVRVFRKTLMKKSIAFKNAEKDFYSDGILSKYAEYYSAYASSKDEYLRSAATVLRNAKDGFLATRPMILFPSRISTSNITDILSYPIKYYIAPISHE